jgi:hypothetical protein
LGKVDVQQEETTKCTVAAIGIWVLASGERFSEIATGRSYFQQGLTTTEKIRMCANYS